MEEKKKLLSIRDLVVKFHVRGRVLTAIRGISLDIYENESIAIVGESGSGKSVFTKTFAGMLDGNGFIDQGTIKYYDDSLSKTVVRVGTREMEDVNRYAEQLNAASVYEAGADIYHEMEQLKLEKKNKGRLSEEEYQKYVDKIEDLKFQRTEKFNYRQTLDSKKQKDEIRKVDAEIRKFDEQCKAAESEYKKNVAERSRALKADTAYLHEFDAKMSELKDKYDAAVKNANITMQTRQRNVTIAKEIVLSVDRFPALTRMKRAKAILKGLKNAMKELGIGEATVRTAFDLSDAQKKQAFTFVVKLDDTEISGEFGDMTFSNGIAMFTLKDGESITAEDLPAGVGYEVIEAAGPDYTAEITGDKGTIEAKTDAEAAFTNTFKEEQKAAPVSPAGTSAPDSKTQTGDPATMALVLLALVISGSLMALMAKRSRQH